MVSSPRFIKVRGKRLYRYGIYKRWLDALRIAKYYQKKNRSSYYILKAETDWGYQEVYILYLSGVISFA